MVGKILSALMVMLVTLSGCTGKVTMNSLLDEMTDRESLTRFKDGGFIHKQFSSYNRASVSPGEDGWFANSDMSHFIRVEENQGRREFVMLDAEGPGAIVRWWMTFYKAQDGVIRIYLDGDTLAAIEGSPASLLSGNGIAHYPFSASVQKGAALGEEGRNYDYNLYFPVPFSTHCKVTYECDSLRLLYDYEGAPVPQGYYWPDVFYNIGCRLYKDEAVVKSFSENDLKRYMSTIVDYGQLLLSEPSAATDEREYEIDLTPGDSLSLEIIRNNSSVNLLTALISAPDLNQALRSVVLCIRFDGIRTVWVPAGEFFGAGYSVAPHSTWMNQLGENGLMKSFWVMPFREKCEIIFLNYGSQNITLKGKAGIADYNWKPGSMYFGATWHEYYNIQSRDTADSPFDLNIVDIKGEGLFVGDQVTLFNNTWHWWGEGDEKIFVDGETFPSSFGTGTEDYYGYSFGRQEPFSHPFISQPEGKGNMSFGPVVNMRHRSLDAIPFNESIEADMELWHWKSVKMNYAITSYFYAMPGFSVNIEPDIESVKRPVIITREDFIEKVK